MQGSLFHKIKSQNLLFSFFSDWWVCRGGGRCQLGFRPFHKIKILVFEIKFTTWNYSPKTFSFLLDLSPIILSTPIRDSVTVVFETWGVMWPWRVKMPTRFVNNCTTIPGWHCHKSSTRPLSCLSSIENCSFHPLNMWHIWTLIKWFDQLKTFMIFLDFGSIYNERQSWGIWNDPFQWTGPSQPLIWTKSKKQQFFSRENVRNIQGQNQSIDQPSPRTPVEREEVVTPSAQGSICYSLVEIEVSVMKT